MERFNYFLSFSFKVLCEASQCEDEEVQLHSLTCLVAFHITDNGSVSVQVKTVSLYLPLLDDYMSALVFVFMKAVSSENKTVASKGDIHSFEG